jgi:hypothetical protein
MGGSPLPYPSAPRAAAVTFSCVLEVSDVRLVFSTDLIGGHLAARWLR